MCAGLDRVPPECHVSWCRSRNCDMSGPSAIMRVHRSALVETWEGRAWVCPSARPSCRWGGPNVPIGPSCGLLHCRLAVDVQARAGAARQSVGRMCGRDVSMTGCAERGIQSAGKLAECHVARGIDEATQCDRRVLGAGASKVRGI